MAKLTEGEWAVLEVLWQGESFPLGEIVSALEPTHHWRRMEAKGLVTILRQTEPHRYAAAVSRDDCARQARGQLLDQVYGGAAGDLIAAFLKESTITSAERDRLRRLLEEMEI